MGNPGEVYVMHNCGLREGLLKIGLTTRTADVRARELMTTGVPHKFLVLFSWRVNDAQAVERRLHERFDEYRVSENREFFQITPVRAISALLEEAGIIGRQPTAIRDHVEVLSALQWAYGPLIDPDLIAVSIEVDAASSASLVCSLIRGDDEIVLRRDMDLIMEDSTFFPREDRTSTDGPPADAEMAAHLLLNMHTYELSCNTPIFSNRSDELISDLYYRAELDDAAIRKVIDRARADSGLDGDLDAMEARIRRTLQLPALGLNIVSVREHAGRFLLSLRDPKQEVEELRIIADKDDSVRTSSSHAVVTRAVLGHDVVTDLQMGDAVEIGHRDSSSTWTSNGPQIHVAGTLSSGVLFEQSFSFLP